MFKPGSRVPVALFTAATLSFLDARMALAQTQQPQAAQEGIQEIVVTAQKREENLQNVPIAISALSAEALSKRGVTDFAGVANASTSINFTPYPSSSNTLILYMRGQGVADANQITQDGSVGLYEDGFYIARPQLSTFDLADVERVEVLRGPQGTLYGRNTTGGAVNIISKKPTGELGFKFSLDGGNRSYVRALGVIDLPKIAGGLSTKVSLLYSNLDGNITNTGSGPDYQDFNRQIQKGGRFSARWDNGSPFTADYFFEIGEIYSTPIYYQNAQLDGLLPGYDNGTQKPADNTWMPLPLALSYGRYNADGLTLAWHFSDAATLKSLTSYRGMDSRFFQNYAGAFSNPAGVGIGGLLLPTFTPSILGATGFLSNDAVQSNDITQELQLVGDLGKRINYALGLYYFQEHANHAESTVIDTRIPDFVDAAPLVLLIPAHITSDRYVVASAKSKAVYGQLTWTPDVLSDRLSLTAGARYTKDDRSAARNLTGLFNGSPTCGNPPFSPPCDTMATANNSLHFSKFNPAGTINMAWTPDVSTYLRVATGYKAGGSSEAGPLGSFGLTFGPENVTSYELGLKSYWWQHRVRANVAAFHSDFKDMQLQFNTDPSNLGIVLGTNAGKAKVDGAELELLFVPINDLTLGFDYTYLHSSMDRVTAPAGTVFDPAVNPLSPYHVGDNVAALFRLPYAPSGIFNVNADWTMLHTGNGSLELALNYRHQGRQYDSTPTGDGVPGSTQYYSIPSYGVLNGRLSWNFALPQNKTARVSLWANNLTNEKYQAHVIGQGAIVPLCARGGPGVGIGACYTGVGAVVDPVAGYTYQSTAWAPAISYGVQFQYGF